MIIIKEGQKIKINDTLIPNGTSKLFYIEDKDEKFAVTNEDGKFSFFDLKAPEKSYYHDKRVFIETKGIRVENIFELIDDPNKPSITLRIKLEDLPDHMLQKNIMLPIKITIDNLNMNKIIIDKKKLIDFLMEKRIITHDDDSFLGTIKISELFNFLKISTSKIFTDIEK